MERWNTVVCFFIFISAVRVQYMLCSIYMGEKVWCDVIYRPASAEVKEAQNYLYKL